MSKLYGVYGKHSIDKCPLVNKESRKNILQLADKIKKVTTLRFIGMYHSALKHTFLWAVYADDPQTIQRFLMENNFHMFNMVRIVPLSTFEDVVKSCQDLEKG